MDYFSKVLPPQIVEKIMSASSTERGVEILMTGIKLDEEISKERLKSPLDTRKIIRLTKKFNGE